jgi:hypothetical protein
MAIVFPALTLMEMLWQLATQGMTNMLQRLRGTAGLTATVAMVLEDGAAMSVMAVQQFHQEKVLVLESTALAHAAVMILAKLDDPLLTMQETLMVCKIGVLHKEHAVILLRTR